MMCITCVLLFKHAFYNKPYSHRLGGFQQYFSHIMVVSFIGGWNASTRSKTTDLLQVKDKLYHIMLYQVCLTWAWFELTILVVIGTDCIHVGNCKSNYHTITTATLLSWWCNFEVPKINCMLCLYFMYTGY
jgi:hypothetical protein